MNQLANMAPLLIPVLALLIPIVAIIGSFVTRSRREELLHETLRQLSERGQPIPPELLNGCAVAERRDVHKLIRDRNSLQIAGSVNVAAGLGLVVMFMAMSPQSWLWAIGCLPLFIGVALLLVWKSQKNQPVE